MGQNSHTSHTIHTANQRSLCIIYINICVSSFFFTRRLSLVQQFFAIHPCIALLSTLHKQALIAAVRLVLHLSTEAPKHGVQERQRRDSSRKRVPNNETINQTIGPRDQTPVDVLNPVFLKKVYCMDGENNSSEEKGKG